MTIACKNLEKQHRDTVKMLDRLRAEEKGLKTAIMILRSERRSLNNGIASMQKKCSYLWEKLLIEYRKEDS